VDCRVSRGRILFVVCYVCCVNVLLYNMRVSKIDSNYAKHELLAANSPLACRVAGCRIIQEHPNVHEPIERPFQCLHSCPQLFFTTVMSLRSHLRHVHDAQARLAGRGDLKGIFFNFIKLLLFV
jgi:hypothetical protein